MHKNGFKKTPVHSSQPCPSTPKCHSDPSSCLINFLRLCMCVCVSLESCFQVIPPQPHNNPVRSGLLLPCSDDETQAQGDGVTSFPESGGWKQSTDLIPSRGHFLRSSLPWCGSGGQRQVPVPMLCVNGNTSAPGCTLMCFV